MGDAIISEAKMVKALVSASPSLDKNGAMKSCDLNNSDFSGLVPPRRKAQTPNTAARWATPFRSIYEAPLTDHKATIARGKSTPNATPMNHDEFRLNDMSYFSEESILEKTENLQTGFHGLPKPRNSVSVLVPLIGIGDFEENDFIVEDSEECKKRD